MIREKIFCCLLIFFSFFKGGCADWSGGGSGVEDQRFRKCLSGISAEAKLHRGDATGGTLINWPQIELNCLNAAASQHWTFWLLLHQSQGSLTFPADIQGCYINIIVPLKMWQCPFILKIWCLQRGFLISCRMQHRRSSCFLKGNSLLRFQIASLQITMSTNNFKMIRLNAGLIRVCVCSSHRAKLVCLGGRLLHN